MNDPEALLATLMHLAGLPEPERQYRFARPRRQYRADFAWPDLGLIVEVQGGGYVRGEDGQVGGRHNRAAGYAADCERMALAIELGWRVLYVTTKDVRQGRALRWVEAALRAPLLPRALPDAPRATKRSSKQDDPLEAQLRAAGIEADAARRAAEREKGGRRCDG